MDDQRFGAAVRAARTRRGLRQADLALAAGLSRGTVSRIERGHLDELTFAAVRAVATELAIRVEVLPRSRNGDLDRLVNARHSLLAEAVIRWLRRFDGWVVRPEVSFAHFSERGVIDLLAWHPARRSLLVIELKTDIIDVGELLATLGRKARLAAAAAAPFDWKPATIGCVLVVADSRANRGRVQAHAATLRAALPSDGRGFGAWLRSPAGELRALTYFSNARRGSVRSGFATVRRVRVDPTQAVAVGPRTR